MLWVAAVCCGWAVSALAANCSGTAAVLYERRYDTVAAIPAAGELSSGTRHGGSAALLYPRRPHGRMPEVLVDAAHGGAVRPERVSMWLRVMGPRWDGGVTVAFDAFSLHIARGGAVGLNAPPSGTCRGGAVCVTLEAWVHVDFAVDWSVREVSVRISSVAWNASIPPSVLRADAVSRVTVKGAAGVWIDDLIMSCLPHPTQQPPTAAPTPSPSLFPEREAAEAEPSSGMWIAITAAAGVCFLLLGLFLIRNMRHRSRHVDADGEDVLCEDGGRGLCAEDAVQEDAWRGYITAASSRDTDPLWTHAPPLLPPLHAPAEPATPFSVFLPKHRRCSATSMHTPVSNHSAPRSPRTPKRRHAGAKMFRSTLPASSTSLI
eukprot:TRINITY_DN11181_c0_g1_i1.p1 TRINITY_DN11181_c0_g1~~TRINITY_DN11181_c0_g1_i1.p1  ORF type:complete len:376 (+),score=15.86 TRINITY_DN11181_c0_g1_i1:129-1256(+)